MLARFWGILGGESWFTAMRKASWNTYRNAAIASVVVLAIWIALAPVVPFFRKTIVGPISGAGVALAGLREERRKSRPTAKPRRLKRPAPGVPAHLIDRVAGSGGIDSATAERLIRNAALRHKGKPLQWAADKVLMDLERDRR
jgi:hypothetical protein